MKRSLLLRRCDDQIFNQREEDIKSVIEKQNDCVKVQEIFKYNSSKNIKVTFNSQHMASQVLTKGLKLFNLSHPERNICKEIFVEILICLNATSSKITPHRHDKSQTIIKYAHYVSLLNTHTVNAFRAIGSVLTVKKATIIALLL